MVPERRRVSSRGSPYASGAPKMPPTGEAGSRALAGPQGVQEQHAGRRQRPASWPAVHRYYNVVVVAAFRRDGRGREEPSLTQRVKLYATSPTAPPCSRGLPALRSDAVGQGARCRSCSPQSRRA
ncbi:hypothetical protein BU16DRAFT_129633 [Lophium mytilinum]|uniref:Uncharacterized protein n=1 Tax=Lophium mytilinum TaxID=390894 RepID=A0A6A6QHY9_9PEZI|nr:hypothetical protein BU16DRAFT_129633 [Lophium mytilinum]